MIVVEQLTKRYDDVVAVDRAQFMIPSGVICGFIGPNGAGKTTTLRMLATLERPCDGTAYIDGMSVTSFVGEVRKMIGFMPDFCGTYAHICCADFLEIFARACGLHGIARRRRTDDLVDFLGLGDLLERPVEALSKGQKQRLSLARALLADPSVLLMDEPAAGLDPRARVELYRLLGVLAHQGTTIFISSHILRELCEVVSWAVVIDAGAVTFHGPVGELARQTSRSHYTVELDTDPLRAKLFLQAHGQTHGAISEVYETGAGQLRFELDERVMAPEDLLTHVIAAGFRVRQFYRQQQNLDELFMRVTAGGP